MKTKFLRESPPRYVDAYSQAVLLFSGMMQQFGWMFFAFGMIFFWVFGMQSAVTNWLSPISDPVSIEGVVQSVESANATENDTPIYKYTYTYNHDNREYEGYGYGALGRYATGDSVPIEYSSDNPDRSRITNLRRSVFSGWAMFVLIFPLAGVAFIVLNFRKNIHYLRLLRVGRSTTAAMDKKVATGSTVTINDVEYPVYKYTFKFEVSGKTYESVAKTHVTQLLEDEEREIVLYDHLNPKQNVLFDSVSTAPRIDERGYLKPASPRKMTLFIVPVLAVIINVVGYLLTIGAK